MTLTVMMLVAASSVGLLVGKSGQFFKYMEHTSGTHMYLQSFDDMLDGSTNRTLTITGTQPAVLMAVKIVMLRLKTQLSDALEPSSDKVLVQWIIPQANAGLLIGKNGSHIKYINATSGSWVKISHPEEVQPLGQRIVYVRGTVAQTKEAVTMIQEIAGGSMASLPLVVCHDALVQILDIVPDHAVHVKMPQTTGNALVEIHIKDLRWKSTIQSRWEQWKFQRNTAVLEEEDGNMAPMPMCLVLLTSTSRTIPISLDAVIDIRQLNDSVHNTCTIQALSLVGPLESILQTVQMAHLWFPDDAEDPFLIPQLIQQSCSRFVPLAAAAAPKANTSRRNLSPDQLHQAKTANAALGTAYKATDGAALETANAAAKTAVRRLSFYG